MLQINPNPILNTESYFVALSVLKMFYILYPLHMVILFNNSKKDTFKDLWF